MEKKFEKKRENARLLYIIFRIMIFSLLSVLAGHLSVEGQFCQPSTAN